MRSKIILILMLTLLIACDQVPTTLDEDPYVEDSGETVFAVDIASFEFDYLSKAFFFSINATSPHADLTVSADLSVSGDLLVSLDLNDLGTGGDIQVNDHSFDMNWELPDSLLDQIEDQWTLSVHALSNGVDKQDAVDLQPELPKPPVIESVSHRDTLQLASSNLVLDTLGVVVSHPQGLDEVRDVSMMSLKPDGNYANGGQPILLYDDGGKVVFFTFEGIDFTSGDQVEGDGTYSLMLPLSSSSLAGTYYWTFSARTWEGLSSEAFEDSLVVLDSSAPLGLPGQLSKLTGVFQ